MAQLMTKVHELKQKASDAIADVPDNLIGTIIAMTILTVLGLGILIFMGYMATNLK